LVVIELVVEVIALIHHSLPFELPTISPSHPRWRWKEVGQAGKAFAVCETAKAWVY